MACLRLCHIIWHTSLLLTFGAIYGSCVGPGDGTLLFSLSCICMPCRWKERLRTIIVSTRLPLPETRPFHNLQPKRDPSWTFCFWICRVDTMQPVKVYLGTTYECTSLPLRSCWPPQNLTGSVSSRVANMFTVALKPATQVVTLSETLETSVEVDSPPPTETPTSPVEPAVSLLTTTPDHAGHMYPSHTQDAAERRAVEALHQQSGPTKEQVLEAFCLLPRSVLRRTGGDDDEGLAVSFAVGGVNPRSSSCLLNLCNSHPSFVRLVVSFVKKISPTHKFSTFVVRRGCYSRVHRDVKNGPCPSLVVCLSTTEVGDGLWVHDRVGTSYKRHFGRELPGTVVPLDAPFSFDARKILHAGHVVDPNKAQSRIILVAFTTLNARYIEPRVRGLLQVLGFPLPRDDELHMHDRTSIRDEVPRLKQLTMKEAMALAQEVEVVHEVIEIVDSQE